jgi:hypothetical protein
MKISLSSAGLLENFLSRAGGKILSSELQEAAEKAEARLEKDGVPMVSRHGATYSKVFAKGSYSYTFTLQRDKDSWCLISIHEENTEVLACKYSGNAQNAITL